jgi:hypothetical protein
MLAGLIACLDAEVLKVHCKCRCLAARTPPQAAHASPRAQSPFRRKEQPAARNNQEGQ